MIINTFSYLWSTTAINAMSELTQNGYNTFEVPISSPHCWPVEISDSERAESLATLKKNDAKIRSLNAGGYDINLASPAASMRQKSIEHIASVIDLAVAWDVPEVVISPGTRRPMISPSLENSEDDGLPRRPRPVRISRPGESLTAEEFDLRARLQTQPHPNAGLR